MPTNVQEQCQSFKYLGTYHFMVQHVDFLVDTKIIYTEISASVTKHRKQFVLIGMTALNASVSSS